MKRFIEYIRGIARKKPTYLEWLAGGGDGPTPKMTEEELEILRHLPKPAGPDEVVLFPQSSDRGEGNELEVENGDDDNAHEFLRWMIKGGKGEPPGLTPGGEKKLKEILKGLTSA